MNKAKGGVEAAKEVAGEVAKETASFAHAVDMLIDKWRVTLGGGEQVKLAQDTARHYLQYIREIGDGASLLFEPRGVAVSYAGRSGPTPCCART